MLDLKLIRENLQAVKTSLKRRGGDFKELDELLKPEESRRLGLQESELLKNKKNNCYRRTKMSKISNEGLEQILVIKNALDSMYDKLDKSGNFEDVQTEFEAIAGIVALAQTWEVA